jgi:hypothetical protein
MYNALQEAGEAIPTLSSLIQATKAAVKSQKNKDEAQ